MVDVLMLQGAYNRREWVDQRAYDIIQDPLIDDLEKRGYRVASWERPVTEGIARTPRFRPTQYLLFPRIALEDAFLPLRSLRKHRATLAVLNDVPRIQRELVSRTQRGKELGLDWLLMVSARVSRLRDWFLRYLNGTCAKATVVENWYAEDAWALCAACRTLGIPVYDIQHGLQGEFHHAYGRFTSVPPGGFDIMPDGFLCWDRDSADSINAWAGPIGRKAYVVGFRWLERWKDDNEPFVQRFDKAILAEGKAARNVLVTFGPRGFEEMKTLVCQAAGLISVDVKWWFRLHPQQTALPQWERLFDGAELPRNVSIRAATQLSLHGLLRHMNHHITGASSVVFESEKFGVPSSLVNAETLSLFGSVIGRGVARVCLDPQGLADHVSSSKPVPPRDSGPLEDITSLLCEQSRRC